MSDIKKIINDAWEIKDKININSVILALTCPNNVFKCFGIYTVPSISKIKYFTFLRSFIF